ncbi:MAG TPA: hypothetical protein VFY93_09000 [Planctomycetota bacterium]|nr:hypothetical protein [Planctomycetota bacterium]
MRRGSGLLLLAGALFAGDPFGGSITGGKAKELVDRGMPMLKEAGEIYNHAYVLEEGTLDERESAARRAVALFDQGTALLQQALEIEEDGGVNAQIVNAARKLAKLRAWLFHLEMARKAKERAQEPEKAPEPKPEPKPAEAPPPPAPPSFPPDGPPASPADVALPEAPYDDTADKKDLAAIHARIQDYYQSFRPEKLVFRHRVCQGKGKLGGGAPCEECGGTGKAINLHYFRKVFWTTYTPLFRDAQGASGALAAFYERARKDPDAVGAVVKACKVTGVDYHGVWARAKVQLSTAAGAEERAITLVGIGSTWFFYQPGTDRELIER